MNLSTIVEEEKSSEERKCSCSQHTSWKSYMASKTRISKI